MSPIWSQNLCRVSRVVSLIAWATPALPMIRPATSWWGRCHVTGVTTRQHYRPRPPAGSDWKGGASDQALGRSRGGLTTKIHMLADTFGRPLRFIITAGQASDITQAPAPLHFPRYCGVPPHERVAGDSAAAPAQGKAFPSKIPAVLEKIRRRWCTRLDSNQ